jgi:hypothetical protein
MDAGQRVPGPAWFAHRAVWLRQRSTTEGLGVWFPEAARYTVSTATELVEQHRGRARVHSIVPIEPAKRSVRAIHLVDTIIHDNDRVAIVNSIFGHVGGSLAAELGGQCCS